MTGVKVLLSSSERKAVFRAIQNAGEKTLSSERVDALLDDLDDGGIWNPCFFVLPYNRERVINILVVLRISSNEMEGVGHDLEMVSDRISYTRNRRQGEKKMGKRWPFVMRDGYYGPGWEDKREKVIDRDGGRCRSCGLSRESHREEFDTDLHVHHRVPLSECDTYEEANSLNNLKTLCFPCHRGHDCI